MVVLGTQLALPFLGSALVPRIMISEKEHHRKASQHPHGRGHGGGLRCWGKFAAQSVSL